MPISVVVLSDFVPEAMLMAAGPEVVNKVISDVMAGARAFWIKRASERLNSTRRDYIAGIQEVELLDGTASIALTGALPNMVEQGADAFDLRETLLGPNVPVGPGGKRLNQQGQAYRAIPFRHMVAGSAGKQAMGSQYQDVVPDAAALGRNVYRAAKALKPTRGMPGGGTKWGDRLPAGLAPKLRAHHKTDIYAGMVKMEKTYARATQSTYGTFRTISEANPEGWMHPGFEPANLADDVHRYVEQVAPAAFLAAVGGAT